jgi:hypothetical protein
LSAREDKEPGFFDTREVMEQSDSDFCDEREVIEEGDPKFCEDRQVLEQSEPEIGRAEEDNMDMVEVMMQMLSKELIHVHADDSRLGSQILVVDCPTEPEIMQYEDLTVRHRVYPEFRSRELASPLYGESDKSSGEVYMRVASPDIRKMFPRPMWNPADMLDMLLEDTQRFISDFKNTIERVEEAEREYRMRRAEVKERFRRREEERMRREEEERRRREEEDRRRREEEEKKKQLEEE